jgi:hypothetical protein
MKNFLFISSVFSVYTQTCFVIIKCKVYPTTENKVPEGEYRYSSTLSLTSALDGGG